MTDPLAHQAIISERGSGSQDQSLYIGYQTFAHWVQQRRHARGDYRGKVGGGGLRLVEAVL
ncbi:MAG: hypothetical protein B7Z37_19325, partial [Verrucomicrobia bacterium 12-59-8]